MISKDSVYVFALVITFGALLGTSCKSPSSASFRSKGIVFVTDGMGARVPSYDKLEYLHIIDEGPRGYADLVNRVSRQKDIPYNELYIMLDLLNDFYLTYESFGSERASKIEDVFLKLLNSARIDDVSCSLTFIYYHPRIATEAINRRIISLSKHQNEYVRKFAESWQEQQRKYLVPKRQRGRSSQSGSQEANDLRSRRTCFIKRHQPALAFAFRFAHGPPVGDSFNLGGAQSA